MFGSGVKLTANNVHTCTRTRTHVYSYRGRAHRRRRRRRRRVSFYINGRHLSFITEAAAARLEIWCSCVFVCLWMTHTAHNTHTREREPVICVRCCSPTPALSCSGATRAQKATAYSVRENTREQPADKRRKSECNCPCVSVCSRAMNMLVTQANTDLQRADTRICCISIEQSHCKNKTLV